MPRYRAYIFSPAGSPSCPPNARNGCFNTGMFDSDAPRGQGCLNADPQQFDSLATLTRYAAQRGETLMQIDTVAAINRLCSSGIAPVQVQMPSNIPGSQTFLPFVSANTSFYPPASCGGGQKVGGNGGSNIVDENIQLQSGAAIRTTRIIDLSRSFPLNSISY